MGKENGFAEKAKIKAAMRLKELEAEEADAAAVEEDAELEAQMDAAGVAPPTTIEELVSCNANIGSFESNIKNYRAELSRQRASRQNARSSRNDEWCGRITVNIKQLLKAITDAESTIEGLTEHKAVLVERQKAEAMASAVPEVPAAEEPAAVPS